MNWKKEINSPSMFEYETSSRRDYIRVFPSEDEPIIVRFEKHGIPVSTIGAGGLSFHNGGFKERDAFSSTFNLPGYATAVSADIVVVDICRYDVCHCRFTDIREEDKELLHQYCLAKQKELIRLSKKKGLRYM